MIITSETTAMPAARWWLRGHAAFTALAVVAIAVDPAAGFGPFATAAMAAYAGAGVTSVLALGRLDKPGWRKALTILHFALIPAQFLYLFPPGSMLPPAVGMLLSALLVPALRPRFVQLPPRARKIWLTVHVGCSVGWLGACLGMAVLAFVGLGASRSQLRHDAYELMHVFDVTIVIPSMAAAIITGLVLSLGTPWGVVKYRWVLTKLIIAVTIPILATIVSMRVETLADRTLDPRAALGAEPYVLAWCMVAFVGALWAATALSVFKPGGRTRWGRSEVTGDIPVLLEEVTTAATDTVELRLRSVRGTLPSWRPGAHIDLVLPSGLVRQYSLTGDPSAADYRVAVRRETEGRGGSAEIHTLRAGARLAIRGPRNNFPLVEASDYVFIAGGIGIAPFPPMLADLERRGARWRLLYRGSDMSTMAFADELRANYPSQVSLLPSATSKRPDWDEILAELPPGVAVYCCGPEALLGAVEEAMARSCPRGTLHVERFAARDDDKPKVPFTARLSKSGVTVGVTAETTLLEAIREVDPARDFSCDTGVCGSCVLKVLEGTPEHRDELLHDRDRTDVMYPCVSRARGDHLVLDA